MSAGVDIPAPALFADAAGSADGPPIVFLHGFGGHHGVWDGVRAGLGPDVGVIAYDLPGHGGSLPLREAVSPRKAAAAILADLKARNVAVFHLVGHSMGGAVATLMALAEPDLIASLTLLAPGGYGETINEAVLRRFAAAQTAQDLAAAVQPMCGSAHRFAAHDFDALVQVRALPGQPELLADLVATIARDGRQGVIPRAAIDALAMPVTVVWGDEDHVLGPEHANGLPAHFRLLRVEDAGHMLPEERPALISELLLRRPR